MDVYEFETKILKKKEALFKQIVKICSEITGVEQPKLKFWDGFCPADNGEELAHYHYDVPGGQICISRQIMKMPDMDFDKIIDTAEHEFCHYFEDNHGPEFQKKLNLIRQAVWKYRKEHRFEENAEQTEKDHKRKKVKKEKKPTKTEIRFNKIYDEFKYEFCRPRSEHPFKEYDDDFYEIWSTFPNKSSKKSAKNELRKTLQLILGFYKKLLKCRQRYNRQYQEEMTFKLILPLRNYLIETKGIYKSGYLEEQIEKIESEIEQKTNQKTERVETEKQEEIVIEQRPVIERRAPDYKPNWVNKEKEGKEEKPVDGGEKESRVKESIFTKIKKFFFK